MKEYLPHFGRGVSKTMRGGERAEAKIAEELGNRLFEAVFEGDVRDCLRGSLDEAARQDNGLRIRLHLMGAPELSDLPWEFLYNASLRRFLALSIDTPVVRYLEVPESIRPLAVTLPLRVLVMLSSPTDYPTLDVEKEWAKLNEAMGKLQSQNLVALERLDGATLTSLQRQLRASQYHIFHYVGHGCFNQQTQDGELVLEDAQKQGCLVSGRNLGMLLHDHRPMRLVLLNSCEGARISCLDPFGGTAQSLVLQGIPAVLAMQFEISDEAAITVCREFYGALADGYPVDAALTEARKALYSQGNYLEWGTPVLYMRSPDGRIFDLSKTPTKPDTSALFREAQAATDSGNWGEAIKRLQEVLSVDPHHKDAATALRYALQMEEVAGLYQRGKELQEAGNLEQALGNFRRVREMAGNYRNVDASIQQIEEEMKSRAPAFAGQLKAPAIGRAVVPVEAAPIAAPPRKRWRLRRFAIFALRFVVCLIAGITVSPIVMKIAGTTDDAVGIAVFVIVTLVTAIVMASLWYRRSPSTTALQGARFTGAPPRKRRWLRRFAMVAVIFVIGITADFSVTAFVVRALDLRAQEVETAGWSIYGVVAIAIGFVIAIRWYRQSSSNAEESNATSVGAPPGRRWPIWRISGVILLVLTAYILIAVAAFAFSPVSLEYYWRWSSR